MPGLLRHNTFLGSTRSAQLFPNFMLVFNQVVRFFAKLEAVSTCNSHLRRAGLHEARWRDHRIGGVVKPPPRPHRVQYRRSRDGGVWRHRRAASHAGARSAGANPGRTRKRSDIHRLCRLLLAPIRYESGLAVHGEEPTDPHQNHPRLQEFRRIDVRQDRWQLEHHRHDVDLDFTKSAYFCHMPGSRDPEDENSLIPPLLAYPCVCGCV